MAKKKKPKITPKKDSASAKKQKANQPSVKKAKKIKTAKSVLPLLASYKDAKPPEPPDPHRPVYPPEPPEPCTIPNQKALSEQERRFVTNYLIDENGARAYRETFPGGSYDASRTLATRMLSREHVRREVEAGRYAIVKQMGLEAEEALQEIVRVAFFDPVYLVDEHNQLLPLRQVPLATRRAIQSVKTSREHVTVRVQRRGGERITTTVREQVIEYKAYPKLDALDRICRYLGIKTDALPDIEAVLALLPPKISVQLRAMIAREYANQAPKDNALSASENNGHVSVTAEAVPEPTPTPSPPPPTPPETPPSETP